MARISRQDFFPSAGLSGMWRCVPAEPAAGRLASFFGRARPRHFRFRPFRIREIAALVMPPNGVTNGPCNTSNPSNITACLGDTGALTLSCVSPGQDAGVAPPGRRLPAPLPPRQGNRPSFYPVLPTPREARIGETQIPFGGSRSHCAAAQPAAGRHQLNTPRAAAAA